MQSSGYLANQICTFLREHAVRMIRLVPQRELLDGRAENQLDTQPCEDAAERRVSIRCLHDAPYHAVSSASHGHRLSLLNSSASRACIPRPILESVKHSAVYKTVPFQLQHVVSSLRSQFDRKGHLIAPLLTHELCNRMDSSDIQCLFQLNR